MKVTKKRILLSALAAGALAAGLKLTPETNQNAPNPIKTTINNTTSKNASLTSNTVTRMTYAEKVKAITASMNEKIASLKRSGLIDARNNVLIRIESVGNQRHIKKPIDISHLVYPDVIENDLASPFREFIVKAEHAVDEKSPFINHDSDPDPDRTDKIHPGFIHKIRSGWTQKDDAQTGGYFPKAIARHRAIFPTIRINPEAQSDVFSLREIQDLFSAQVNAHYGVNPFTHVVLPRGAKLNTDDYATIAADTLSDISDEDKVNRIPVKRVQIQEWKYVGHILHHPAIDGEKLAPQGISVALSDPRDFPLDFYFDKKTGLAKEYPKDSPEFTECEMGRKWRENATKASKELADHAFNLTRQYFSEHR